MFSGIPPEYRMGLQAQIPMRSRVSLHEARAAWSAAAQAPPRSFLGKKFLKRSVTTLAIFVFTLYPVFSQGVITTFAGADWLFPGDGRPAINAPLGGALSLDLAADRNGNYYICDEDNSMVMRVGPDGILTVVAGNGLLSRSGDGGLAVNASLNTPISVAVDSAGNIYIGEWRDRASSHARGHYQYLRWQ